MGKNAEHPLAQFPLKPIDDREDDDKHGDRKRQTEYCGDADGRKPIRGAGDITPCNRCTERVWMLSIA